MTDIPSSGPPTVTERGIAVAVLGAGIMGSAMARRLAAAGLRTTVWDRSPQTTAPLAAAGTLVAASPWDAVAGARVVITMLPTTEIVDLVIFAGGVAEAFADGGVGTDGHHRRRRNDRDRRAAGPDPA
jgi:3-hydroxyisobutyrate dehydrogenase-like beta-hydroxyacid dehydrogenase